MLIFSILIIVALSQTYKLKKYSTDFKISDPKTSEIHNFVDEYYYIDAGIGSPLQFFELLVDINSQYTWIADLECYYCEDADNLYNSTSSTTDSSSGSIITLNTSQYSMVGEIISERFRLNDHIDALNFSIVRAIHVSDFENVNNDGVIGLAPEIWNTSKFNLAYQMYSKSIVSKNSFSLFFTSNYFDEVSSTEPPATILFGGIDSNRFAIEDMTYIKSEPNSNIWESKIHNMSLDYYSEEKYTDTDEISTETISVKFNTGINWIELPHREFNIITEAITKNLNCYMISQELYCIASSINEFPHIVFNIDGYNFEVSPENYIQGTSAMCRVLLKKSKDQEVVLGLPFFRRYYSFFDVEKRIIGLGLAVKSYNVIIDGGNTGVWSFGLVAIVIAGYGWYKFGKDKREESKDYIYLRI